MIHIEISNHKHNLHCFQEPQSISQEAYRYHASKIPLVLIQNMRPSRVQRLLLMFTENHLNDSVIICCDSLLTCHLSVLFLDKLLTGDKKWIF